MKNQHLFSISPELVNEYGSVVEVAEEAYRKAVASGSLVEQLEQTVAQLASLSGELEKDRVSFVISLPSHLPLLFPL